MLNLLSVGAAYGIIVWIFQEGHLESFLGFNSSGAIISWMPMFLFVVLFGLSMDYHVFILSRIREALRYGQMRRFAWDKTQPGCDQRRSSWSRLRHLRTCR